MGGFETAKPDNQRYELEMAHDMITMGIPIVVIPCLSENDRLIAMTIRIRELAKLEALSAKVNEPDQT